MKLNLLLRRCVVSLSLLGMMTAQLAQAAGPAASQTSQVSIRDVALTASGSLEGQVMDAQGAPEAGSDVALVQEGKVIAATRTNADGEFALPGVQAGVYQLVTPKSSGIYRVWAPQTAPPSAQQGILLVSGDDIVRQQGMLGYLANPWVLAAIVAAAIAIPLALDDDDAS